MLLHERLQLSWFGRCVADGGGDSGGAGGDGQMGGTGDAGEDASGKGAEGIAGGDDSATGQGGLGGDSGEDGQSGMDVGGFFGMGPTVAANPTTGLRADAIGRGIDAGVYGGKSTDHDPGAAGGALAGLANTSAQYNNPNSVFGQTVANLTAGLLSMSPLGQLMSGVVEGRSNVATGLNTISMALGNPMAALSVAQGLSTVALGGEKSEKDSPGPMGLGGYDSVGSAVGAGLGFGANANGVTNATGVANAPNTNSDAGTDITSSSYTGNPQVQSTLNNTSNTGNNIPNNNNTNQPQSLGSPLVPIATPNNMQLNPDLYSNTFNQNAANNGSTQRVRPFLDPFGRTSYQNY